MSETPTDRVELTEDEIQQGTHAHWSDDESFGGDPVFDKEVVESIVAARLQAYAEKFESLSDRARKAATELGDKNDRLAAELAATNADRDWEEAQKNALRKAADKHIAALQETLDRVTALADEADRSERHINGYGYVLLRDLRAALTPEGKP